MEATSPSIGLHDDPAAVLDALVRRVHSTTGVEIASGAVVQSDGTYRMSLGEGIRSQSYRDIVVTPGMGLGGRVLAEQRPARLADYGQLPEISSPHRYTVVDDEGVHGASCVPVYGPDGVAVLLYAGVRHVEQPSDILVSKLEALAVEAGTALHHIAARARDEEIVALRERQRLANGLHDSIAQMLFAIGIAASQARNHNDSDILAAYLADIEQTSRAARTELRTAFAAINRVPQTVGLHALLEAESRTFARSTGVRVWWTHTGTPRLLSPDTERLIVDTLREGLRNAFKHAHAEQVVAAHCYEEDTVKLILQMHRRADSTGWARSPTRRDQPGSGLGMLIERAAIFGGQLTLETNHEDEKTLIVQTLRIPTPTYR